MILYLQFISYVLGSKPPRAQGEHAHSDTERICAAVPGCIRDRIQDTFVLMQDDLGQGGRPSRELIPIMSDTPTLYRRN